MLEVGLATLLHIPLLQREGILRETARLLYIEHRDIVQFLRPCTQFHLQRAYTLRPGECDFRSSQFDTTISANRLGVRDDEQSTVAPEVVVLGDSYTMGWGVAQDETYPHLLEQRTGRRVLNAAVSSYGTARQVMLLRDIDTSAMRHLIVQYASNDFEENTIYLENGLDLGGMSEGEFDSIVSRHTDRWRYFPGMYASTLALARWQGRTVGRPFGMRGHPHPDRSPDADIAPNVVEEARALVDVLETVADVLDGVRLTVLVVSGRPYLVEAILREAEQADRAEPIRRLAAAALDYQLGDEDYFLLDDHFRPSGHVAIADYIAENFLRD